MKNGTLRGHVLSISKPSNNVHVTAEVVVIILAKLTMNAVNDFRIPGFRNKVTGHFMRSYIKRSVTQCYCTDLLTPYHGAELQMYWLFLVCKHVTRRPCWWSIHFFFKLYISLVPSREKCFCSCSPTWTPWRHVQTSNRRIFAWLLLAGSKPWEHSAANESLNYSPCDLNPRHPHLLLRLI